MVSRRSLRGAALLVILGVFSVPVNAQQPFKTNDAPTVEKGVRQVQFLNSFDRMDESLTPLSKQNWANLSLGLGISQQMEIGIAIPYLAVGGTAWQHGIGDLEINAKVQIVPAQAGRRRPGVSIATKVEFPTGDSEQSLGSGFVDWENTLIVESNFLGLTHQWNAGVTLFGNTSTGIEGIREETTVASYGYAVSRQLTRRLRLGAELTGALSSHLPFDDSEMEILTGGMYQFSNQMSLDLAYSFGIKNASPDHGFMLGCTVVWKSGGS